MDRDSMRKMRLDRRLIRRRDWIKNEDLTRDLEALPDVSAKIAPPDDSDDAPSSGESDSQPTPG